MRPHHYTISPGTASCALAESPASTSQPITLIGKNAVTRDCDRKPAAKEPWNHALREQHPRTATVPSSQPQPPIVAIPKSPAITESIDHALSPDPEGLVREYLPSARTRQAKISKTPPQSRPQHSTRVSAAHPASADLPPGLRPIVQLENRRLATSRRTTLRPTWIVIIRNDWHTFPPNHARHSTVRSRRARFSCVRRCVPGPYRASAAEFPD